MSTQTTGTNPYTRHGHLVAGLSGDGWPEPNIRARCGGPGLCQECSTEAERIRREHALPPVILDDADSLESAVGQAVGAASTCWQTLDNTGTFDTERASQITEELLAGIRSGRWRMTEAKAIDDDPEFFHGLTLWTEAISAQVRDYGLVIHAMPGGPTEQGDPILSLADARRLRDLLNVATARGAL
jgi:hypothetical protein